MSRIKQVATASAITGLGLISPGCSHSLTPPPGVVAVFAGGTVGESEIVDASISTGDVDQRIRDVAWR